MERKCQRSFAPRMKMQNQWKKYLRWPLQKAFAVFVLQKILQTQTLGFALVPLPEMCKQAEKAKKHEPKHSPIIQNHINL